MVFFIVSLCFFIVVLGVVIRHNGSNNLGRELMLKVNLAEKFALFNDYWSPKIVGELNDSHVKLAKFKGEFVWHKHDLEDELFLVIKGTLLIKLHDQDIHLNEGEFVIIPKGVEHMPVADEEVHVLLIELKGTLNTGDKINELTVKQLGEI
jgi:mannose-6-phosphate isomerase-like protein (cupin superfamily)